MISHLFDTIYKHFSEQFPREACGVLQNIEGEVVWRSCRNVSNEHNHFTMDPRDFIKAQLTGKVVGIVHSHTNGDTELSEYDIAQADALGVEYYVIAVPEQTVSVYKPENL